MRGNQKYSFALKAKVLEVLRSEVRRFPVSVIQERCGNVNVERLERALRALRDENKAVLQDLLWSVPGLVSCPACEGHGWTPMATSECGKCSGYGVVNAEASDAH